MTGVERPLVITIRYVPVLPADVNADAVDIGRLDVDVDDIRDEGREARVVGTPGLDVSHVRPAAVAVE